MALPSFEQRVQQQEQRVANAGGTMVGFQGPESLRVDTNTGQFETRPYDVDSWMRGLEQQRQSTAQLDYMRRAEPVEYAPNGLPEPWDYRTATEGPFGQPKPPNAIGWTPHGEAYYGEGPVAWLSKWADKYQLAFSADGWDRDEILQQVYPEHMRTAAQRQQIRQDLWDAGDTKGWASALASQTAQGLNVALKSITYGENSPSVLKRLSMASGLLLSGLADGLGALAMGVERAITPSAMAADEIIARRREASAGFSSQWDKGIMELLNDALVIPHTLQSLVQSIPLGISRDPEYLALREKYEQAGIGRMGYTALHTVGLKEEFMRRIDAGDDPRLLAMELADQGAEFWGQVFYDPLNALGAVTKPFKAAARARQAARVSSVIPDLATVSDDVMKAMAITSKPARVKALEEIATGINEAVQGYKWKAGRRLIGGDIMANSIEDLARMRGPRILTASGKQGVYSIRVGNFLNEAAVHFQGNPDRFLDFVEGMVKLSGGTTDEIAEALALMGDSGFSLNRILSPGGVETSYIMRNLMMDADGNIRRLDDLVRGLDHVDDVGGFAEKVATKLDDALKNVFPTLTEEIKRADELAKITDDAARAKFLAKYPYAENPISPFVRSLNGANEAFQSKFFTPAYRWMNTVYMGMNPAYRLRNRWTNTVHVLVDAGPEAAFKSLFSPVRAAKEVEAYLGFIPKTAQAGIGGMAAGALDTVDDATFFNFFSKKAGQDEMAAGMQVYRASVRETMNRGLKAVMADAPEALNTFTPAQQNIIKRLMRDNKGNVEKTVKALMDMQGEGYSAARNLMFLADEDVVALQRLGLYDETRRIAVESDNLDDAMRQIEDLRTGHHSLADEAARETPLLQTDNLTEVEQVEHLNVEALEEAITDAKIAGGEQVVDEFSRKVHSDRRARQMADHVAEEVEQLAIQRISGPAASLSDAERMRLQQGYLDLRAMTERNVKELWQSTNARSDKYRAATWGFDAELRARDRLTQKINKGVVAHDVKAYEDFVTRAGLPAKPPEYYADLMKKKPYLARRMLQSELWVGESGYYAKMQNIWGGYRNQHVAVRSAQVQEMAKLAGMNRLEVAHKLDLITFENDVAKMMGQGKIVDGSMMYTLSRDQTTALLASRKAEAIAAGMSDEAAQAYAVRSLAGRSRSRQDELKAFLQGSNPTYSVPVIGPADVVTPSHARVAHETRAKVDEVLDKVLAGLQDNFNDLHREIGFSGEQMRQLRQWQGTASTRIQDLRSRAVAVADEARNFTLLNYKERYGMDLAAGWIYPYHYWYSRTYKNWFSRLVADPALIANYGRYKRALGTINAGAPEWFKYQVNASELLGFETDSPFYFNLEATLSPLYGITGVDFEDPRRRLDWWSRTMEDLGKFGPSVWTPYQLALAAVYHVQGKDEAASRWAGRLIPQTLAVRDITSLAGWKEGKGLELDPAVWMFSGGMTAQDRARIGRALTTLQESDKYTDAQIMDAAYTQQGPIWDEATVLSLRTRTPNLLTVAAPYIAGVGFRMRTAQDVEIDRMYSEMYNLMNSRDLDMMDSDEYAESWARLREKYPFMSALLLSRKAGPERDEAFAWDVLDRVPPGSQATAIYESLGINYDDISPFYDVKGDVTQLDNVQRHTLMAAVLKLGTYLELPGKPTRAEWDEVSRLRGIARDQVISEYGEEIYDLMDGYWQQPEELRDEYAERHPGLEEALSRDRELKLANPLLAAYYMPMEKIERYLKGEVWAEAERRWPNIYNMFEVYGRLKDQDPKAARAYWKKNDDYFKEYQTWRDDQYGGIASEIATYGLVIPDAIPAEWREGMMPEGGYELEDKDEAWIRSEVLAWSADRVVDAPAPTSDQALMGLIQTYGPAIGRLWTDNGPLPDVVKELLSEYNLTVTE